MSSTLSVSNSLSILHQVPEGHVGVYWRGGALLKTITDPGTFLILLSLQTIVSWHTCAHVVSSGFHVKMPLITQYEPVQVTIQTDQVKLLLKSLNS